MIAIEELVVTVQGPVPEHIAELHPAKADPDAAVAVRVTVVPGLKPAEQVLPQVMPTGELDTLPAPLPDGLIVTVYWGGGAGPYVAVTAWLELMARTQLPVPEQAPLQPVNTEPDAGVATRLTDVPDEYCAEQVAPQLIPAGLLVVVPVPVPAGVTVSVKSWAKFALRERFELIVTVHVPVPLHDEPLQPVKTKPAAGVAVNVTLVP